MIANWTILFLPFLKSLQRIYPKQEQEGPQYLFWKQFHAQVIGWPFHASRKIRKTASRSHKKAGNHVSRKNGQSHMSHKKIQIPSQNIQSDTSWQTRWPGSLSLWLVLSPPAERASNGQVLHPVWCLVWRSLRALLTLKSPKKVKNHFPKSFEILLSQC